MRYIRGGQGRSAVSLLESGYVLAIGALAVLLLMIWKGC